MTSTLTLKEELSKLKTRLETIDFQITSQTNEINSREENMNKTDKTLSFIENSQGDRLKLNVGGTIFTTSLYTINQIPNSLLSRLINTGRIDIKEEIFIDRSPRVFSQILDFYRYSKIDYVNLTKEERILLKDDAEYYNITEISMYLNEILKEPEIVTGEKEDYIVNDCIIGNNDYKRLNLKENQEGICSKGNVFLELNAEYDLISLVIRGYDGNNENWFNENGAGSKIYLSTDNKTWKECGKVPSGFGKEEKEVEFKKGVKGRYVKIVSKTYVGLSYLRFIRRSSDE